MFEYEYAWVRMDNVKFLAALIYIQKVFVLHEQLCEHKCNVDWLT